MTPESNMIHIRLSGPGATPHPGITVMAVPLYLDVHDPARSRISLRYVSDLELVAKATDPTIG